MRYIKLNPVRADMVKRPEEYKWSSYGMNGWGDRGFITPHAEYLMLGNNIETRLYAYRELFKHQLSEYDLHVIREAAHYCQPVGNDRFKQFIEQKYGIKIGNTGRGRPTKVEGVSG